jgi:hypothetical protein
MSRGESIAAGAHRPVAIESRRMRREIHRAIRLVVAIAAALALIEECSAADCNSELAQMQGERRDVAARANDVALAIEQFETCARQNANLGNVPDSCRGQADDYQKAVTRLNTALDNADSRVRTVGGSCVQPPAPASVAVPARPAPAPVVVASPPAAGAPQSAPVTAQSVPTPPVAAPQLPPIDDPSCDTARSYKGKMPFAGVVKICLRTLSETQCRQCLGSLEDK